MILLWLKLPVGKYKDNHKTEKEREEEGKRERVSEREREKKRERRGRESVLKNVARVKNFPD